MKQHLAWPVPGILTGLLSLTAAGAGRQTSLAETIACRALEVHAVENLGVTLVIFHQRDAAARSSLGELLRQHSGATIEFQTRDGPWHAATLLRLKYCFGRGLLVFASASARLADKEDFLLRLREESSSLPDAGAAEARREVIRAMKEFEKSLGLPETRNFLTASDKAAYYACYSTGPLELPDSYQGMRLRRGTKAGCKINGKKHDVFFYAMDAVGNGKSPTTSALVREPVGRMLTVVPHEDFHEAAKAARLPATIKEAAATLVGFLAATEFAKEKFGATSAVAQELAREPELFLEKSKAVNAWSAQLEELYRRARSRELARQEALGEKARLFRKLGRACAAIEPTPLSFNKCPAVENNAGLAFDRTYTKYYPLFYDLYLAEGRQAKPTLETIRRWLATTPPSEAAALDLLQSLIEQAAGPEGVGRSHRTAPTGLRQGFGRQAVGAGLRACPGS